MYSEALNASLQSALGFAENNLPFLAHSGAAAASMASFHHHQQQREREEKQGLERQVIKFNPFYLFLRHSSIFAPLDIRTFANSHFKLSIPLLEIRSPIPR